jgi:hypothetical protein
MLTTNKKILAALGLAFSLSFFNSCAKKNDETTIAEDKENVEALFDDIVEHAEELRNGCGVSSFDKFYNFDNGTALNRSWVDMISYQLETALDYSYVDQTRQFDFNRHVGTYSWDANTQTFMMTSGPNDKVVVNAPVMMGLANNNATATVSAYTQQSTVFDGEQYYLPNTASIDVQVDNSECMGIELKEAAYDNGTFMMPNTLDMLLTLAPFDFEIKSSKVSGNTYDMEMTAMNDGEEEFGFEGELTFADSDFSDLVSDDVERAVGEITFGDFTMPFDVNIKALNDLLNPSQTQINELIKVSVKYKGNDIADLEFEDGSTETITIIYRDDSREDLYSEYKDLVDRLEIVFSNFIY